MTRAPYQRAQSEVTDEQHDAVDALVADLDLTANEALQAWQNSNRAVTERLDALAAHIAALPFASAADHSAERRGTKTAIVFHVTIPISDGRVARMQFEKEF